MAAKCRGDSVAVNDSAEGEMKIRGPGGGGGDGDDGPGSRRGALIALIVLLALVIGGLWLIHTLRSAGSLQDCVMAGRTNCAPVEQRSLEQK
jgi:hypothetical protein